MKKVLVTLLLAFGALFFSTNPAISMPPQASFQQQDNKKNAKKDTQTVTFKTSMHCANCVKKITDNISFEKGVKDMKATLDDKLVKITYDPAKTDEATLAKAIKKLGYSADKVEE